MSLKVVNFGSGKGGLSTVGYTIYGADGAEIAARSTSGVNEIGTSTGVYAANITVPDYDAILLWDTGEATPRYATEDYQHQIQDILDNTGRIQNIYNSVKNIGEFMSTIADKLGLLPKNEGLQRINDKIDALSKKENISLGSIEEAFSRATEKIKLPEIEKAPDYSGLIQDLANRLSSLKAEIDRVPKSTKEYTANFNALANRINELEKSLKQPKEIIDTNINNIRSLNNKVNSLALSLEAVLSKIVELKNNDKGELNKKELLTEIQKVILFIQRLAMTKNDTDILMAFGHKR